MCPAAYKGRGCHASCVCMHFISFHFFGSMFFLMVSSIICRNLILPSETSYFYPAKMVSVSMKQALFTLKYFAKQNQPKCFNLLSNRGLNDALLRKNPAQRITGNKMYIACLILLLRLYAIPLAISQLKRVTLLCICIVIMTDKTRTSLKPLLTKRPFVVRYRERY